MPQLKTAEQCLRLAADCRVAADAAEGENKGRWVQLATRWDALAQVRRTAEIQQCSVYRRMREQPIIRAVAS